jgi:hypothetical protein
MPISDQQAIVAIARILVAKILVMVAPAFMPSCLDRSEHPRSVKFVIGQLFACSQIRRCP